jgi:hypothetical protein
VVVIGVLGFGIQTEAEEPGKKWSVGADSGFQSKYVWRGASLVDEPVWQPGLTLSYQWVSVSWWGNLEMTDVNECAGKFTEVDYTLDLSWSGKKLNFSGGAIIYRFPNSEAPDTTELYAAVGADVPFFPTLTIYQDVDEVGGTYLSLALGYEQELWKPSDGFALSLSGSAAVGLGTSAHNEFNYCTPDGYSCADQWGLTDLVLAVGVPLVVKDQWGITPAVNFSSLLDKAIRELVEVDQQIWAGLLVSYRL